MVMEKLMDVFLIKYLILTKGFLTFSGGININMVFNPLMLHVHKSSYILKINLQPKAEV